MYYGWRAKLGVITPANGTSMEMEFHEYVPDGVAVMTQRILFEKVDKEGLSALAGRSVEAAQILSSAKPDILLFGCTTGSLIQGLGYDAKLIAQLEKAAQAVERQRAQARAEKLGAAFTPAAGEQSA